MDAFSVSVSAGFCTEKLKLNHYLRMSFSFGFFQFIMPLIGFAGGKKIEPVIRNYDHWIAFFLLSFIGIKMIHEYFKKQKNECASTDHFCAKNLFVLSVATSIDALAVGVTFGVMNRPIILPSIIIGIVCAVFTCIGIYSGRKAGHIVGKKAELAGGVILVGIGLKILIEHTLY